MARGGKRTSPPGTLHSNRVDMTQPIKAVTGAQYGQRQAIEAAQRAIPLPANQGVPAPAGAQAVSSSAMPAQAPGPVALPGAQPFTRPTERPGEPVTAGLPTGAGPGPEALQANVQQAPDLIGAQLRAVFAQYPNDDLLRVMALHEQGR